MLKVAAVLVGAVFVLLFASQTGLTGLNSTDDYNVGSELATATELVSEQVGDVADSLGDVSTVKTVETSTPVDLLDIASGPTSERTIEKVEVYERTPVGMALARLASLDSPGRRDPEAFISAVNDLQSEWDPRYETAKSDHGRLLHRLASVEETAAQYFLRQAELTARIHDPDLRADAAAGDAAEYRDYEEWLRASRDLKARVDEIVRDIDDMDVIIKKLNLSANFSALHTSFESLTLSITGLHRDLEGFRLKSDEIARTFSN
ncbi:MAG: hypothetical protein F4Y63_09925 [Chloroflexi bacterium]|nr:hypothetical protein [Chloroflexota bacterium]MYF78827.1 hypothetical protein [Chloroflexota bacterium]MYK62136.1 hypothetical protein [Chloroflexota bacterium]